MVGSACLLSGVTMNIKKAIHSALLILAVSAGSVICVGAFAQSQGGDFEITKSTIDSGGGTSSGGDFSLTGTIGQHDANPQISSGGQFSLAGGFWANAEIKDTLFEDGFEGN